MLGLNLFRNILRPPRTETRSVLSSNVVRSISHTSPLAFNITPCLMAMPTKKRRRVDPQTIKVREERKKRKIEKAIRQLERMKKSLKPIEESIVPYVLRENKEARERVVQVPQDEKDRRITIIKEWGKIKMKCSIIEKAEIRKVIWSQERALNELRKESKELYEAAIQMDPNLLPFKFKGPSETPSLEGYAIVDGEYIDMSKNWLEENKTEK